MILVHKLMITSKNAWKYTKDRLTHTGMSNASYDICGYIYHFGGTNQDSISKALHMDKSSVAKIVNKCVNDGLVERKINPENRREYILELTEYGKEVTKELIDVVQDWQDEVLSILSEEERNHYLEISYKLQQKSEQMNQ